MAEGGAWREEEGIKGFSGSLLSGGAGNGRGAGGVAEGGVWGRRGGNNGCYTEKHVCAILKYI